MLYNLDFDYKTLTTAEPAELTPQVPLPADFLKAGMVLRGKLGGKMSKAEGPANVRFAIYVSPREWSASTRYALGELATNDGLKQYRCTAAGVSDTSGGPTGGGLSITDGTVTWDYLGESPVVLDTHDIPMVEAECTSVTWRFDFDLHVRHSRDLGVTIKQYRTTVVSLARLESAALPGAVLLPAEGTYPVIIDPAQTNVLHIRYTPEQDTGSILCMTYVLESVS